MRTVVCCCFFIGWFLLVDGGCVCAWAILLAVTTITTTSHHIQQQKRWKRCMTTMDKIHSTMHRYSHVKPTNQPSSNQDEKAKHIQVHWAIHKCDVCLFVCSLYGTHRVVNFVWSYKKSQTNKCRKWIHNDNTEFDETYREEKGSKKWDGTTREKNASISTSLS